MLIVRDAQLAVLRRREIERFKRDLVRRLLADLPGPCAAAGGEAPVRALVDRVLDRAGGLGIEREEGVAAFASLLLQYGESFERSPVRPWTLRMLANHELPGDLKVAAIRDRHDEETGGRILVSF